MTQFDFSSVQLDGLSVMNHQAMRGGLSLKTKQQTSTSPMPSETFLLKARSLSGHVAPEGGALRLAHGWFKDFW